MKGSRLLILAGLMFAAACAAQDEGPKPPRQQFYKLDYVVKEVEGDKVVNSKAHAISVQGNMDRNASIRSGSKVTVQLQQQPGLNSTTQYDLGLNLDTRNVREVAPGYVAVSIDAEMLSLVVNRNTSDLPPVTRTNRWSTTAVVPLKKPTVVFSSDDQSGSRKMQLELTATPLL